MSGLVKYIHSKCVFCLLELMIDELLFIFLKLKMISYTEHELIILLLCYIYLMDVFIEIF